MDASRSIEIDLVALDKTNESVAKFERQGPNETRGLPFFSSGRRIDACRSPSSYSFPAMRLF